MEEIEIASAAIKGDDIAFVTLMQFHKSALYKTALAYLKNEDAALEALQEVTVRAYMHIRKVKEPQYIKTWLIRIMINYCNDAMKKQRAFVQSSQMNDRYIEHHFLEHMELIEALDQLELQTKELLILRYFHDLKIKDIAVTMNRSEGTIKTWISRGLLSLRNYLKSGEGTENDRRRDKA